MSDTTTTTTEAQQREADRKPGVMEQIFAAVPDHAYSERRPFHWQIRWSSKSGVWAAECGAFQPVSITGPGFRFKPATGAQAVGVLRLVGAIEPAGEPPAEPEPAGPDVAVLLHEAWGVIANAGQVDGRMLITWKNQHPDWVRAAERWRDRYHAWLRAHRAPAPEPGADLWASLWNFTFAQREKEVVVGFDPAYTPADPPDDPSAPRETPGKEG